MGLGERPGLSGDDLPPETFDLIGQGKHYAWPDSYSLRGKAVPDPDFGRYGVRQTGFPALEYQAHSAPLGMTFYTGDAFPRKYRQGFFVCFHGSWNRSIPTGYKVVFVPLRGDRPAGKPRNFLWGFLQGPDIWAARGCPGRAEGSCSCPTTMTEGFSR